MKNTIVLLGMSGVGKSFHSGKLKREGYKVFHIDDQIALSLGEKDVHDIASWLGQPYDEKYKGNSETYLSLEDRFTREALVYAENHPDERIVIDTTGSLVYLGDETLEMLSKVEVSILLDSSEDVVERMIGTYLREPKPVIWGEMAALFSKEGYLEEVKTFYPELLRKRRSLYLFHAKKVVPFSEHKELGWSPLAAI